MSGPSLIHSSTAVDVSGCEFITSANDANVHKSYYNLNIVFSDVTGFFHFATKHLVALVGSKEPDPVEISDIVPSDPSSLPPVSSIADRYTRCMLECMVGYPLYNPKPFSELSMAYPRNGVNVGDVGFVRRDGVFDFLFNICPSQNGLINPPYLPGGFSLETPNHSTTRDLESLPPNTCLFPKSITKTVSGEYICKGSEGAVLALPEGAIQHEAINTRWFEDLAKRHGMDWYKYTMNRGRSIPNGSLYLVTSFTKCTPWGIAVFDRPCDPEQILTFVSSPLSWNGFGAVTTKVANTNQGDTPNQCIFLRGYKIKLRQDIFDHLYNDPPRGSDSATVSSSPDAGSKRLTRQPAQRIRGGGGTDFWSKISSLGKPSTPTVKSTVKKTDEVLLQANFNSSPFHPSDLINTALLSQNPDAKVASTHDDVWCDLMRDNFPTLNYATLMSIAQSYTSVIDDYGCVSLEKICDSRNVDKERSHLVPGTESLAVHESKTGIERPSIRVEGTPPEVPREGSIRRRAKETIQNLFSNRSSHSRVASKGLSQRETVQEYLSFLDDSANPNIGDKKQSVEVKNDLGESFKPANQRMQSVEGASGEAQVSTEDTPVHLPTVDPVAKDQIDRQEHQAAIQALNQIRESVLQQKFPHLDEAKDSDDHATKLGPGGFANAEFRGTQNFNTINVGKMIVSGNSGESYDISILKEFVSFKAIHDSYAQDPTNRVHHGTRQYVLQLLRYWIRTPSAKERILWLHGPVGVGKSAIAQTIARSCAREELAATFFFYRTDPGRNDGNRLFTTLAWQLAYSIPATKDALTHSLIERPDIPMKDIETQFEELIVKPFLALKSSGDQLSAPVVIIDGLDECSDDSLQRRFLTLIGNAVNDNHFPLRFLICCRPEAHIRDVMNIFRSLTLSLDLTEFNDANQDIEKYLRDKFSCIATEQELDLTWPGEQIIQEFVSNASGQFGYASTVIKRLGDEYSSAETQLDIIRGLKPPLSISPFAELDALYMETMRRQRDPVFLKDFLSLLIGRDGMNVENLHEDDALLMNVSEKELQRKLRGMHSLLKLRPYIDAHYRSFLDFLQDASRSGQYHISKQAGTRRYLDFIAGSLVRYALTVMERHDDHNTHFSPRFYCLASSYPAKIALPVEEWQEALQPLVHLQNKLLTLPNFRSTWELLPCTECTGFRTMRDLLLHLAFRLEISDPEVESNYASSEGMRVTSLIPIKIQTNTLEMNLDACLSSLLSRLQKRKSLDTDTIQLTRSLLHFDHTEIAMKVRSVFDAQNLVDLIDELINKNYLSNGYMPDTSGKAVQLALEIYARVPVLPRSLFSKGTVDPHHYVWTISRETASETEILFQTAFMCKILDPRYIVRVSWTYEQDNQLWFVDDKENESMESLSQWRIMSKPNSGTTTRVMLEVVKAVQYFHAIGIVLHDHITSHDIFMDSESHPRFRFLGLTAHYVKVTPKPSFNQKWLSPEDNILFLGYLFYEMFFDVEIKLLDNPDNIRAVVTKRPLKPEIRDDAWQLIQRCCAEDSKSRPTMDEVLRELEALYII